MVILQDQTEMEDIVIKMATEAVLVMEEEIMIATETMEIVLKEALVDHLEVIKKNS